MTQLRVKINKTTSAFTSMVAMAAAAAVEEEEEAAAAAVKEAQPSQARPSAVPLTVRAG